MMEKLHKDKKVSTAVLQQGTIESLTMDSVELKKSLGWEMKHLQETYSVQLPSM